MTGPGDACVGGHGGVFGVKIFQDFLRRARAESAIGGLHFRVDFGHFGGEFLAERGPIELQETFDFVGREMLVVNGYELRGGFVGIEFGFVVFDKRIYKLLAAVICGNRGDKSFAKLVGAVCGGVLHSVARAYKLHQRPDVRFLDGIDGMGGLACGRFR